MSKAAEDRLKLTKEIIDQLSQFEEGNVEYYGESNQSKKLLNNPNNGDLKSMVDEQAINNPFKDIYIWIKGELLDLQGINDALQGRDGVIKTQASIELKRIENMKKLDGLKGGKKSLGTMFKSAGKKENDMIKLE